MASKKQEWEDKKLKWELAKMEAEVVGILIRNVMLTLITVGMLFQVGNLTLKNIKFSADGVSIDFAESKASVRRGPSPAPTVTVSSSYSRMYRSVRSGTGGGGQMSAPIPTKESAVLWGIENSIVLVLMILAAFVVRIMLPKKRRAKEALRQ